MKIRQTLRTIASNAFSQDGFKPDPTRLRLDDATPIYSGWLARAFSSAGNQARLGIVFFCAAAGATFDGTDTGIKSAIESIQAIIIWRFLDYLIKSGHRKILEEEFGHNSRLCFNTDPATQTPTSAANLIKAVELAKTPYGAYIAIPVIYSIGLALAAGSGDTPLDALLSPTFFSCAALNVLDETLISRRFKKVVNGEWSIEDTPPGQKKPAREPVLSRLRELVPRPAMVNAYVEAPGPKA